LRQIDSCQIAWDLKKAKAILASILICQYKLASEEASLGKNDSELGEVAKVL